MLKLFNLQIKDKLKRNYFKKLKLYKAIVKLIIYIKYKYLLNSSNCNYYT